jgi:hypothetical protein
MKLLIIFVSSIASLFILENVAKEKEKAKPQVEQSDNVSKTDEVPGYCETGDDEDPQPMLTGTITDNSVAKNPISNACVEVRTTGGVFVGIIGSNNVGHYYFNSLANGTYYVTANATGHTAQTATVNVSGTPQSVDIALP